MTIPAASPDRSERFVGLCLIVLRRIVGFGLFALGVAYWVRLVGVFPGKDWRFDLMSPPWRVAAVALSVLCPVAGVGLWLSASWGAVVWVILVALQLAMHVGLPHVFGGPTWELTALLAALGILVALKVASWDLQRRHASRRTAGE